MKFDAKSVLSIVGVVALGSLAVIALLKGNTELATTFAAMLLPNVGQVLHPSAVPAQPEVKE